MSKTWSLICLLSFAVSAQASAQTVDRPFSLSPGSYKFECTFLAISKDSSGVLSRSWKTFGGIRNVVVENDRVTEVSTWKNSDGALASQTTVTTTTSLGNRRFSQEIVNKVIEDGKSRGNEWSGTISVDGNVMHFENTSMNDQEQDFSAVELMWNRFPDNRIIVQQYLTAPIVSPDKSVQTITKNSDCTFTPQ